MAWNSSRDDSSSVRSMIFSLRCNQDCQSRPPWLQFRQSPTCAWEKSVLRNNHRRGRPMSIDQKALERLIAKDEIRDLVLLYSRGCDRLDFELVRTLYTDDATDSH